MKTNHNEDMANRDADLTNDFPLSAILQEDRDEEDEQANENEEGDWGEVDPAGGDAPTAPGSAV